MTTLIAQPVFALWALCSAILVVTMYGLGFWTARTRAMRKMVINPEDVGVNPSGTAVVEVEHADVLRVKRAHLNAIENAVPFFVIGFAYSQTSPSLDMARGLFFAFIGIRILHALIYLNAKQPFRTIAFVIGALINLTMVVQVIRAAIAAMA